MTRAVIAGYARTPFHFANKGKLVGVRPDDLAAIAIKGLVERTGAAAYTTRLLGVANATDVPTRADADTRYASATGLAAGQHVVGVDATIAAGYGVSIPRYFEVSAGFTLELGADADLEIL